MLRTLHLSLFVLLLAPATLADEYPQWLGPHRENVYREGGIVESFPPAGLKTLWRAPIGGGYSQVAVAPGKVIVTDRILKPGVAAPKDPFERSTLPGTERILCVDDNTGQELWHVEYDCPYSISYAAGPRTTPAVDGDRVYTLGAEGDLYCININSGKTLWNKHLPGKAALWGFSGSPLIEGDLVIVLASGRPLLTAFNKTTGDVAWNSALESKDPGYVPPTPVTLNGQRQILQYYPESVAAVDPTSGKTLWQLPYGPEQNGVAIVTPVQVAPDTIVLSSNYFGMGAIKVSPDNQPKVLWHAKQKGRTISTLHSLHSQMVFHAGHLFGVHNTGELLCVDPKDGHAVWSDRKPLLGDADPIQWTAGFLTPWQPNPNAPPKHFFLATEKGDLILCDLSPKGYTEISRTHLLDPTNVDAQRPVLWCHPAYAHQSVYWRNDKELIRVSLAP